MFVFEYDHTNYRDLLQALANALGVSIRQDKLVYPRNVAIGFAQIIDIQSDLQAMAFDYVFTDNFRLKRKKISEEFYTLWFTELTVDGDVFGRF